VKSVTNNNQQTNKQSSNKHPTVLPICTTMDESIGQNDEFLDSLIDDDLDLQEDREEEEIDAHISEFAFRRT
jgi:hypothetical protein